MRINNDSIATWSRFDADSVINKQHGVAHLDSAAEDWRSVGEDAMHLLPFNRVVQEVVKYGPSAAPQGIFLYLFDVLCFIPGLLKGIVSSLAHLVAFSKNVISGKKDGERMFEAASFEYGDAPTMARSLIAMVGDKGTPQCGAGHFLADRYNTRSQEELRAILNRYGNVDFVGRRNTGVFYLPYGPRSMPYKDLGAQCK